MATQNDFSRSFGVNAAMSAFRRVAVSSNGSVGYADNNRAGVGILQQDVAGQSYETPQVRLWGTGTVIVAVTGVPVTVGDTVYLAVTGYVTGVSSGNTIFGRTLTTSATNGDWIEVQALPNPAAL